MVTSSKRKEFWPEAVADFMAQDWANKELVVVTEDVEAIRPYLPDDTEQVRLVHCHPDTSIGERRNMGVAVSQATHFAIWDDDDRQAPHALSAKLLLFSDRTHVVGCSEPWYYDLEEDRSYHFKHGNRTIMVGGTMIFRREAWENYQFPDTSQSEDQMFLRRIGMHRRATCPPDLTVVGIHNSNTAHKTRTDDWELMGDNIAAEFYCKGRRKVALAILSWEMGQVTIDGIEALILEATRLQKFRRVTPEVFILDNGSTDGTPGLLLEHLPRWRETCPVRVLYNLENRGNAIARNQLINLAKLHGMDHILFTDCDLEVIPHSVGALVDHLEQYPEVGCVGLWSGGHTTQRTLATKCITSLEEFQLFKNSKQDVAWTQYGLFRMKAFEFVEFETSGPFGGPGWGLEDNDLRYQLECAGWRTNHMEGATYLHRARSSSVRILKSHGFDQDQSFLDRMEFQRQKWAGRLVPIIKNRWNKKQQVAGSPNRLRGATHEYFSN
jgi:glycosyltransferase involved in cell wall biosynthesis